MCIPLSRLLWLAIGLISIGLVVTSLVLTQTMNLHPCHLCILQRLLFIVMGVLALLAAIRFPRFFGSIVLIAALLGIGVASYQVWLQAQPMAPFSCTSGTPEVIENLVGWLGNKWPDLFLATGLCQEVELTILNLSMATWALIAFAATLLVGLIALATEPRERRRFR